MFYDGNHWITLSNVHSCNCCAVKSLPWTNAVMCRIPCWWVILVLIEAMWEGKTNPYVEWASVPVRMNCSSCMEGIRCTQITLCDSMVFLKNGIILRHHCGFLLLVDWTFSSSMVRSAFFSGNFCYLGLCLASTPSLYLCTNGASTKVTKWKRLADISWMNHFVYWWLVDALCGS